MVVRAVFAVGIALICTAVGCRAGAPASPSPAPPPTTPPVTAEACRACRGQWGVHGLDDKESCNCGTTDGGKRCRDGLDCQGMCLVNADQPDVEVVEAGPPARGFFVGRCSAFVAVFGCHSVVQRGARGEGPVLLGQ